LLILFGWGNVVGPPDFAPMAKKVPPKKGKKVVPPPKRARPNGLMRPFRLSADLSAILGVPSANRTETMKLLW
jgi:hypothetical protein